MEKILKVDEARSRDVGRGIARIDPNVAKEMGLVAGDVIIIEGKKKTACIYWPGYPEDAGKENIRIDGTTRRNAGVSIDDKVKVRKAVAKQAERVTLAPTEELRIVGAEGYLLQILAIWMQLIKWNFTCVGHFIMIIFMNRRLPSIILHICGNGKASPSVPALAHTL